MYHILASSFTSKQTLSAAFIFIVIFFKSITKEMISTFVLVYDSLGKSYRFIESRMGHPKLVGEGFGYTCQRRIGQSSHWFCDQRRFKCHGRLIVKNSSMTWRGQHNHPPDPTKFWPYNILWKSWRHIWKILSSVILKKGAPLLK